MVGALNLGAVHSILPGRVGGFNPDSLPGLAFWAAARLETTYAAGGSVGTMTDQSGEANNLTSAAAENQPTFRLAVIGTQPVYEFDGINDYLRNTAVSAMADWSQSDHAIISVIRPTSVTEEDMISASNSGAGNDLLMVITTGRGHTWRGAGDANAINTVSNLSADTNYILSMMVDASNINIYLNGSLEAGPTALSGAAGDGNEQLFVGNRSGTYGPGWYSGNIAELLIYTTAPSNAQMLEIHAWLNSIYRIY